jgi:hypothetical protein
VIEGRLNGQDNSQSLSTLNLIVADDGAVLDEVNGVVWSRNVEGFDDGSVLSINRCIEAIQTHRVCRVARLQTHLLVV